MGKLSSQSEEGERLIRHNMSQLISPDDAKKSSQVVTLMTQPPAGCVVES